MIRVFKLVRSLVLSSFLAGIAYFIFTHANFRTLHGLMQVVIVAFVVTVIFIIVNKLTPKRLLRRDR